MEDIPQREILNPPEPRETGLTLSYEAGNKGLPGHLTRQTNTTILSIRSRPLDSAVKTPITLLPLYYNSQTIISQALPVGEGFAVASTYKDKQGNNKVLLLRDPNTDRWLLLLKPKPQLSTLTVQLQTPTATGLQLVPVTIHVHPVTVTPRLLQQSLQASLQARTPTGFEENLIKGLLRPLAHNWSNGRARPLQLYNQPINTTVIEGLLQKTCRTNQNTLPLKITITGSQLQTLLQQQLLQNPPQHILLCLQDGKCYGTILDKLITQKILSTGTLTRYAVSCTAATTLCETTRGLLAGLFVGGIESLAACWIPAASAHFAKNKIIEAIRENETNNLLTAAALGLGSYGLIGTAALSAGTWDIARLLYGKTNTGEVTYEVVREAAEALLKSSQGKAGAAKTFFTQPQARKIVKAFTRKLGKELPKGVFTGNPVEDAKLIEKLTPDRLRLLMAAKKLGVSEKTVKEYVEMLREGKDEEALGKLDDELRRALERRIESDGEIRKLLENKALEEVLTNREDEILKRYVDEVYGEKLNSYLKHVKESLGDVEQELKEKEDKLLEVGDKITAKEGEVKTLEEQLREVHEDMLLDGCLGSSPTNPQKCRELISKRMEIKDKLETLNEDIKSLKKQQEELSKTIDELKEQKEELEKILENPEEYAQPSETREMIENQAREELEKLRNGETTVDQLKQKDSTLGSIVEGTVSTEESRLAGDVVEGVIDELEKGTVENTAVKDIVEDIIKNEGLTRDAAKELLQTAAEEVGKTSFARDFLQGAACTTLGLLTGTLTTYWGYHSMLNIPRIEITYTVNNGKVVNIRTGGLTIGG